MFSSAALQLISDTRFLTEPRTHLSLYTDWPASSRDSLVSGYSASAGIRINFASMTFTWLMRIELALWVPAFYQLNQPQSLNIKTLNFYFSL